ncbi:hypothetical protein D3C85_1354250 [compost metagenome]
MFGEGEGLARQQGRAVGLAAAGHRVIAQRIQPVLGKGLATRVQLVAARVVEVLIGIALVLKLGPQLLVRQPIGRGLEAVVFQLHI